jgi:hypothetical protein
MSARFADTGDVGWRVETGKTDRLGEVTRFGGISSLTRAGDAEGNDLCLVAGSRFNGGTMITATALSSPMTPVALIV